jgi:5'-phosphate synthase pdxT subunit
MKRIGIIALQGAFEEHRIMLELLGAKSYELRHQSDLKTQTLDGLIIPGGESTVIGKLLMEMNMSNLLKSRIQEGLPVFGTCAGMILLAKQILGEPYTYLDTMDINVIRNAYGRQLGSFQVTEEFHGVGLVPMTFIRAPYIYEAGENVEVLAKVDGRIVAARQNNMLVTAFHPELTQDSKIHEYFLKMVK